MCVVGWGYERKTGHRERKEKMEVMKHSNKEGRKRQKDRWKGGLCRGTDTERMQNESEHRKTAAAWLRENRGGREKMC